MLFHWKKIITTAALALAAMHANAVPTLTFSAPSVTAGGAVDVDVSIADVVDLSAYQFSIGFDPRMVQGGMVTTGGFLGSAGTTFGDTGILDNANGSLSFVFNALIGMTAGASGSGTLLTIHFETLEAGTSMLTFGDVLFLDSTLGEIAVTAIDSALTILPVVTPPGGDVPEPASLLLLGVGGAVLLARRRYPQAGKPAA